MKKIYKIEINMYPDNSNNKQKPFSGFYCHIPGKTGAMNVLVGLLALKKHGISHINIILITNYNILCFIFFIIT